jgi:uncharacterized phosphosugar-binding protein
MHERGTDMTRFRTGDISADATSRSRRTFLGDMARAGGCMIGIGAFVQACAEKEIAFTTELAEHYLEGVRTILASIRERETGRIRQAAALAVQTRLNGHDLYASLHGSMLVNDTLNSRPGSPAVFSTMSHDLVAPDDFVFSNDAQSVRGLAELFITVVGMNTPSIVNIDTPPGELENMGTLRIDDVSNIVIDCHVPYTDGILNVEGIDIPICPASGVIHSFIYYTLIAELIERLTEHGIYPEIG